MDRRALLAMLRTNRIANRRARGEQAGYRYPYGPLVCTCSDPKADPARDFGMCQTCKRKPLNLMAVKT